MALLKSQKKDLAKKYADSLSKSVNVVVLTFDKIPVNEINQLRIEVTNAQGILQVVKKRILLKAIEGKFDGLTLDQASATVMMLYTYNQEDEHAPLKAVQKYIRKRTKEQTGYILDYVGGRYEKSRQQAGRVKELATLPTKEELVGKFLFLLNHPISSLARAFQAIADKEGGGAPVAAAQEEQSQPVVEAVAEAPAEETPAVAEAEQVESGESAAPAEEGSDAA